MHLDCPHCDTRLAYDPAAARSPAPAADEGQLLGRRHVCHDCENEIGIYHY